MDPTSLSTCLSSSHQWSPDSHPFLKNKLPIKVKLDYFFQDLHLPSLLTCYYTFMIYGDLKCEFLAILPFRM